MSRVRDFQRQKVYDAERQWGYDKTVNKFHAREMTLEEIYDVVVKMFESREIKKRITLKNGKGCRRATCSSGKFEVVLTFPKWARQMPTVCHEVAHAVAYDHMHGPEFCRAMLKLVRDFIGGPQASLLQKFYMKNRVCVSLIQEQRRIDQNHERTLKKLMKLKQEHQASAAIRVAATLPE